MPTEQEEEEEENVSTWKDDEIWWEMATLLYSKSTCPEPGHERS